MTFNFSDFQSKAEKAMAHIQQELGSLRTGRATTQLLDPVMVEAYGTRMRIQEVANVSAPEPTLLLVSPWDKSLLAAIEKAIQSSGINLSPVVDGEMIRVPVPALTEERRREMVKILHQRIEAGRVLLRTIRVDTKKEIEKLKGTEGVSEDDVAQDLEQLDTRLQSYLAQVDQLATDKEKELMTV